MTESTIFAADRLLDASGDTGPGWLLVQDGAIRERGIGAAPEHPRQVRADFLGPGLVDTHVHGGRGVDFATPGVDPSPAIDLHRSAGATTLIASLATSTPDSLTTRLAELRPFVRGGALAGVHLEGPWLSSNRRGAHHPALLRAPDLREIDLLLAAAEGTIRMVTLAPELPGAIDAVSHLVSAGVTVALGHSEADYAVASRAIDAGATVVTHLFNGMPPLLSREPGLAGAALANRHLYLELIADGVHVSDPVVDIVFAAAAGRVSLISDAMAATGLKDGRYDLAGSDVTVIDGIAQLTDGSSLAGSTASLGDTVGRLLKRGMSAASVLPAAATTPARALNLRVPALGLGDPADFVIVTGTVLRTVRGGL